jgi:hypothetical protein
VLGQTKWRPDDIAALDKDTLSFAYFWLKKVEDDWWDRLAKLLGLLWTSDDLPALRGEGGKGKSSSVFLPMLLALKPDIKTHLESVLEGHGTGVKADINLADLPKDEFLKWVKNAVAL